MSCSETGTTRELGQRERKLLRAPLLYPLSHEFSAADIRQRATSDSIPVDAPRLPSPVDRRNRLGVWRSVLPDCAPMAGSAIDRIRASARLGADDRRDSASCTDVGW